MIGSRRRGASTRTVRSADPAGGLRGRRSRWSLPVFAMLACLGFVGVAGLPQVPPPAEALPAEQERAVQSVAVADGAAPDAARDAWNVSRIVIPRPATRAAPAAGAPDPGTAQAIAYDMVLARGWDQGQYDCLVALWNKESHWNVYAYNARSGAYGIPQALPGEKMASAGSDWATNPATQITWGLGYIQGRYGTPCGAWDSSQSRGWY